MTQNYFTINEIRAYSVSNLLEGAAVVRAPDPKDPSFSANNLIENQETRSGRQEFNAIIDWNRLTDGSSVVTRAS